MKNYKKIIFYLVLAALCFGCIRKIYCPSFINRDILTWYPYKQRDTLALINAQDDSVKFFYIYEYEVKHNNFYKTGYSCGGCATKIYINEDDRFRISVSIDHDENDYISESYSIGFSNFASTKCSIQDNYNFNGITISQVKIFENYNGKGRYKEMVLGKGYGILSLTDYNNKTWFISMAKAQRAPIVKPFHQKSDTAKYNYVEVGGCLP
ncbi:MAG TPA: hypothetical protein VIH57_18780 [Bacteroidales bacterium]